MAKFGIDPEHMTIGIPDASAFTTTLALVDSGGNPIDWGVGTTLKLKFPGTAVADLTASITDDEAAFTFSTSYSTSVPIGTTAEIWYTNGSDDYPMWRGPVTK